MINNQSEYIQHLEAEVKFCKVCTEMSMCVYLQLLYFTTRIGFFLFLRVCVCVWLQEELQGMKQRIRVVVVENEKLHSDLKSKAMEESLKEFTLRNTTVMCVKNTCVWSLSLW